MSVVPDPRRTIWVVDDSPTDAERVRRLLEGLHYQVEVLNDGATALERLSNNSPVPDLLLLDWVMPGISGIEVCKFIRQSHSRISHIPVLLLTAQHGPQEISEAFASGANDYVSKPFVEEELRARVESLLQSKRLLERVQQAEADVRSLLTNAPDPIFVVDAQGIVNFANKEGVAIFGGEQETVFGKSFAGLFPSMGLQNVGVGTGEAALPLPDVKVNDLAFSPSIRMLPSDSSAMTTIVLRNVTARRQADARRLDFYSMIAHDLRTPITSVLLRLQMAFRGNRGVLPAEHLADLRKCDTSLRSLSGMINDFLELARLEGIGYKIDLIPVNLGDLVKNVMEDFAPLLEKGSLTWTSQGLDSLKLFSATTVAYRKC
jgi:CheY-like chemotaxis protein